MGTVLIVDDTAQFRRPIAAWTRLAGHLPLEAENGREALELVERERPDLILLDLAMPQMDGLGFLRARNARADLRRIPVILLTAVTEERYIAEAEALGVCDHLLKSQFSMKDMMHRFEQYLPKPLKERNAAASRGSESP